MPGWCGYYWVMGGAGGAQSGAGGGALGPVTVAVRPLMRGSPVSHVEFDKWLCQLSLFFLFPCQFLNGAVPHVEWNGLCYVHNIVLMSMGLRSHVDFRNGHVALSNFRVNGHSSHSATSPSSTLFWTLCCSLHWFLAARQDLRNQLSTCYRKSGPTDQSA